MDSCDECQFVYDELPARDIAGTLRDRAGRYRAELSVLDPATAGTRPEPEVWSVLEYACHVRDVLLVQRERTLLALVEDNPDFPRMYREERAELAGYENQGLSALHSQVGMASELLATVFDGLSVQQLARPCLYNFPARSQRDVTWLGRHTVHELVHHLADIRSVSERVRA